MKQILAISLTCLCIGLSSLTQADEASHRKATEELLVTMEIPKVLGQIRPLMAQSMQQSYDALQPPAEARPILDKYTDKLSDVMAEYLSWDALKNVYIDIYTESFTEAEVKELNELFSTPIGRKFASRSAELMQTSAVRVQPAMLEMQGKVGQLMEDMIRELEALNQ